jgi:uncharacterized protein (TIGR02145 family)
MKSFIKIIFMLIVLIYTTKAQVLEDTIEVGAGWNMIGSLGNGAIYEIIRSEPPGIIVSDFFGYNPGGGYEDKDTLEKGSGYWVKVNENGLIIFGKPTMGIPCPETPTVDWSGKVYNTVVIGSQCWLKENLDIGTMIDSLHNQTDNGIIEKHCYLDDPSNCNTYGGLYQWDEAMQYSTSPGAIGICPPGWHVSTYEENVTLKTTVDYDGHALKASGQGGGTNTSGFSALLAGYRTNTGLYQSLSAIAGFWSSTETSSDGASTMWLFSSYDWITFVSYGKVSEFSIRCIRD